MLSYRFRRNWWGSAILQVREKQFRFTDQMTSVGIQERTIWRDATIEEATRLLLEGDKTQIQ